MLEARAALFEMTGLGGFAKLSRGTLNDGPIMPLNAFPYCLLLVVAIAGLSTPVQSQSYPLSDFNASTASRPHNDDFARRHVLSGSSGSVDGTNVGATGEPGEPPSPGETQSVWWQWTAPGDGDFILETLDSDFDTYLRVFTGEPALASLKLRAANDDFGGTPQSLVFIPVRAGQIFYISVDGIFSEAGAIVLTWQFDPEFSDPQIPLVDGEGRFVTTKAVFKLKGEAGDAGDLPPGGYVEFKIGKSKVQKASIKRNGRFQIKIRVSNGRNLIKMRTVYPDGRKSKFSRVTVFRK